jgi:hypothetical protein
MNATITYNNNLINSQMVPTNIVANILHFITTTTRSIPDLMEAGLLQENWAWVDQRLSQLFYSYAVTPDNVGEFQHAFGSEEQEEEQDSDLLARKHARSSSNILGKRKRSEVIVDHMDPDNIYFIPISNNRYDAAIFTD